MDWRPASQSRSRSRPPQYGQDTGYAMMTSSRFGAVDELESTSTPEAATTEPIDIPRGTPRNDEDEEDRSAGGRDSSGISLLTKNLMRYNESPTGGEYLRSVNPHITLSQALKEKGMMENGGVPASLPAYHHHHPQSLHQENYQNSGLPSTSAGLDDIQQGNIRRSLGSGFPRVVRKTSFDHTVGKGSEPGAEARGRHQVNGRPVPPPQPESALVRESELLLTGTNEVHRENGEQTLLMRIRCFEVTHRYRTNTCPSLL